MQIRIRNTGAVMYEGELRQYMRDHNGPSWGETTPEVLEALGADPVFEGPQPAANKYQIVIRDGVEQDAEGRWFTKYSLVDLDAEAVATKDAEQAKAVREDRGRRLAALDWTQGKDIPDTISGPAAVTRQALRDITKQAGFPWEVTWPE